MRTSKQRSKRNPKQLTKRNSSKDQRRDAEIIGTAEAAESKRNDFTWYNAFPQYTKYAGTIPTGVPLGNKYDLSLPDTVSTLDYSFNIPGIMTLRFIPGIGRSADKSSPINRSAIRWYTWLRYAQKASANYDSQDMMMAFVVLDSAYMYRSWMMRILGLANLATPLNKYTPQDFIYCQYVDADDVRNNIATLWGYINKFAIDLGSVTMPKDIDLRVRHEWMVSGVYLDDDDVRAQAYMFVPEGFYIYDNTVASGSQATFTQLSHNGQPISQTNLMTVADIIEFGNNMLKSLLGDEDLGQISGDILNALGEGNVVRLGEIDRGYTLLPSYNELVMSQIENATFFGYPTGNLNITQDPSVNNGAILYGPSFTNANPAIGNALFTRKWMLNFHKPDPTVEEVIEATRLMGIYDGPYDGTNPYTPTSYGSEILTTFQIWKHSFTEDAPSRSFNSISALTINIDNGSSADTNAIKFLADLASFDWHPTIYLYSATGSSVDDITFCGVVCDFNVAVTMTPERLSDMHEAALTSLFDLPQMGFTNK